MTHSSISVRPLVAVREGLPLCLHTLPQGAVFNGATHPLIATHPAKSPAQQPVAPDEQRLATLDYSRLGKRPAKSRPPRAFANHHAVSSRVNFTATQPQINLSPVWGQVDR